MPPKRSSASNRGMISSSTSSGSASKGLVGAYQALTAKENQPVVRSIAIFGVSVCFPYAKMECRSRNRRKARTETTLSATFWMGLSPAILTPVLTSCFLPSSQSLSFQVPGVNSFYRRKGSFLGSPPPRRFYLLQPLSDKCEIMSTPIYPFCQKRTEKARIKADNKLMFRI